MEHEEVLLDKTDGIFTITLNRPEVLNAFTSTMLDAFVSAIKDARHDNEVKVLVITGAGRGFCTGADARGMAEGSPRVQRELSLAERSIRAYNSYHRIPWALADLDKPCIGAINGVAAAAGMDVASMCDIRIASDRARFGMTFIKRGVVPGDGGCYFLPRIIGIAKACELIWTGRLIDAQEALRIGYVSKVVPHDELASATMEFAAQLAKGPSVAIELAKRLIYRSLDLDMNRALELAETAQLIAHTTEDSKEGPRAWLEKRAPQFKGK